MSPIFIQQATNKKASLKQFEKFLAVQLYSSNINQTNKIIVFLERQKHLTKYGQQRGGGEMRKKRWQQSSERQKGAKEVLGTNIDLGEFRLID